LERAHLDYDYPKLIITLCRKHHRILDNLYGNIGVGKFV
jgi:hypothetical protein